MQIKIYLLLLQRNNNNKIKYPKKMRQLHINKENKKQLYENDVDTVIKDMQRKYNTYGIRYLHYKRWFSFPRISVRDSLHDYGICAKVKDLDLLEYECYVPADEEFDGYVVHCFLLEDEVNNAIKNRSDLPDFLKHCNISLVNFTLHMEMPEKLYYMSLFYDICDVLAIDTNDAIHVDDVKLSFNKKQKVIEDNKNENSYIENDEPIETSDTEKNTKKAFNDNDFVRYVVNKLKRSHSQLNIKLTTSLDYAGLFQKNDRKHTKYGIYCLFFPSDMPDFYIDDELLDYMHEFMDKGFVLYLVIGIGEQESNPEEIYAIDVSKIKNFVSNRILHKFKDSWLSLCYD